MIHDMIDSASYMAHGYCLLWKPWLVALHAGSDFLIFAAYFAIPAAIWIFLGKRKDLELKPLAVLFAAFIFLCGLTHLVQMATLWWPIYETQAYVKVATALVSVLTAVMIFPLIPKAVALPSPRALQDANDGLRRAIGAREETLLRLHEAQQDLEHKVAERTRELERAKRRFEALVTASAQIFWLARPDGSITDDSPSWRAFTGQSYDEWKGTGWLDALHPDDRASALAAWTKAVEAGAIYDVEYRVKHVSGDYRWTAARGVALIAEDGQASEWVGMNEDITARKRSEEHANLIMRELSHRTKNLLAIIVSLVRRTIDGKRDPVAQAADFVDRIHGLARSHDLLVRGEWRGVSLRDLVVSHLEPFGIAEHGTIDGPDVEVRPEAAQNIGLALHELATNAAKHGSLKGEGSLALAVTWSIAGDASEPSLQLDWAERTLPRKQADAARAGFGRTMLEQLVGAALRGETKYDLTETHVRWTLRAPLRNIVGTGNGEVKQD